MVNGDVGRPHDPYLLLNKETWGVSTLLNIYGKLAQKRLCFDYDKIQKKQLLEVPFILICLKAGAQAALFQGGCFEAFNSKSQRYFPKRNVGGVPRIFRQNVIQHGR